MNELITETVTHLNKYSLRYTDTCSKMSVVLFHSVKQWCWVFPTSCAVKGSLLTNRQLTGVWNVHLPAPLVVGRGDEMCLIHNVTYPLANIPHCVCYSRIFATFNTETQGSESVSFIKSTMFVASPRRYYHKIQMSQIFRHRVINHHNYMTIYWH